MSRDHFIAQTYLRRFGDESKGFLMHAYRKSDGADFPCHPADVCFEWDGDLNSFMSHPEVLGDYRQIFEPHWHASVGTLLSKTFSPKEKFNISGYFANLMVCTPAWRRVAGSLYDHHAKAFLSFSKEMQEKHGGNPELPADAIEMLEKGELELTHDPDFIKATVTRPLLDFAWLTYHQDWEIIKNRTVYPFITSDNPVAIYGGGPTGTITRYLPIAPNLCLSVKYERLKVPQFGPDVPPKGNINWFDATTDAVKTINKLVAQCAEELVFSTRFSAGIKNLVRNNSRFRVDQQFMVLPADEPDAIYHGGIICVTDKRQGPFRRASG